MTSSPSHIWKKGLADSPDSTLDYGMGGRWHAEDRIFRG